MGGRRQGYNDYGGQYNPNRYDLDNMRNKQQMRQAPYAPVPVQSVPTMGITINQNTAPTMAPPSPYAVSGHGGLVPSAPPSYHDGNFLWLDRFPRRENRGMFRLCLVEGLLAAVLLGGGIWCFVDTPDYCPYYSGIWTSTLFLLNAIVGIAAAKVATVNLYQAHLVLSLISISFCAVSAGLSGRNWALVGTYYHPRIERGAAFCLLGQHDVSRVSHIFHYMDTYDFAKCLFQLKVGIAVNSVQFVIACIEAFLNVISAFMCCKRTCTTCITVD